MLRCFFSDPLPRLFKPSWSVKKLGHWVGAYFPCISIKKILKLCVHQFQYNLLAMFLLWPSTKMVRAMILCLKKHGCQVTGLISSPELCSGWAIVITFRPSSVHASVRLSVRPPVNIFKWLLLWSCWANFAQISYGASLGWGNEKLLKWLRSVDQDGRHAHIR